MGARRFVHVVLLALVGVIVARCTSLQPALDGAVDGEGAACMYSSECVAGYTCLTPAAGGPGRCTAVCNPQNPCTFDPTICVCSQFNDRPVDFGSCI